MIIKLRNLNSADKEVKRLFQYLNRLTIITEIFDYNEF